MNFRDLVGMYRVAIDSVINMLIFGQYNLDKELENVKDIVADCFTRVSAWNKDEFYRPWHIDTFSGEEKATLLILDHLLFLICENFTCEKQQEIFKHIENEEYDPVDYV